MAAAIPLSARARSAFLIAMAPAAPARSPRDRLSQHCAAGAAPVRGDAEETAELRKNLLTAEAIIKAEPQVLVFWEQGQGVRVMAHTLAGIAGLPQQHAELPEVRPMARPRLGPGAQETASTRCSPTAGRSARC